MTYIKGILIAIDQLGNALAGGNPDCTISGRVGYYQYNAKKPFIIYWKLLALVIDATFFPLDSHHHCREAYLKEKKNEFSKNQSITILFILSFITIGSCLILIVPFYLIWGIKKLIKHFKKSK